MKTIKWILSLVLFAMAGTGSAWADHWHGHSNVSIGVGIGPYWGEPWHYRPYGYPYPYYPYYPPVVVAAPVAPPVYVEQTPAPTAAPQTNSWYYCNASRTYYPYVKECPGGWQQVVPQPPQP